ncbi:MAG: nucleotidyltransferase family protein [Actinomycetota bacterium]|nr:nucleotidyltransferase family protein [Actinomycetota bacterium]
MIAALILAAGGGTRMGGPKAVVSVNGERLVDRAVANFKAAGIDNIFVVLGAWVGKVDGAIIIENKEWSSGMASSLQAGLKHIAEIAAIESVVVSPVDLPGLTAQGIIEIAKTPRELVVATYKEVPGHPAKFARAHWAGIMASAHGNIGARDYLAGRNDIHHLRLDDLADGTDVDTPEELEAFKNHL